MKTYIIAMIAALTIGRSLVAEDSPHTTTIKLISKYQELSDVGLQASVKYVGSRVVALVIEAVDPKKVLPEWMRAMYVVARDGTRRTLKYDFNPDVPDRVRAMIGWDSADDLVLVIGPKLRPGESFDDQKYIAIAAKDLIEWKGQKEDNLPK